MMRRTLGKHRGSTRASSKIRKVSMARILRDNIEEIREVQPQVFMKAGFPPANVVRSCNSRDIPRANLNVFVESEPL